MEMKQISETTLKITISMEDLEERGMELKDFLIPQEKTEFPDPLHFPAKCWNYRCEPPHLVVYVEL